MSSSNVRYSLVALRRAIRLLCLICPALVLGLALIAATGQNSARADDPVTAPPGLIAKSGAPPIHTFGAADREAWEWEVVRLVNLERTNRGIPPLKRNDALDAAAYGHSQDMGINNFFSHTGSDGSTVVTRTLAAGYTNWNYIGENIAVGYNSPSSVMTAWMNSEGHRENILRSGFREIGVGYYYDAGDTYPSGSYWTQDFGSRFDVYPVVINNEAYSTTNRSVQLYVYGPTGAQQMRFSNDGASWSNWETYSTGKTWTLAEGSSGARTVYAQVKTATQTYQATDDIYYVATAPVLFVEPTVVTFLTTQGSGVCQPAAYLVQVSNAGGGTLDWSASESSDWFNITQGANTVTITCVGSVVRNYGIGQRAGAVTIMATGASGSPQNVSVALVVAQEIHDAYLPLAARLYP